MDQLRNLSDDRLAQGCVYCDSLDGQTRDHVPSRVFLEPPLPENLPVVAACRTCNVSFSQDEVYVACLIECAIAGSTNPEKIRRSNIARKLRESPALRSRLELSRKVVGGVITFEAEEDRLKRVLLKLLRGHAAFELSRSLRREPTYFYWWPVSIMTPEQREHFDAPFAIQLLGEIGSRGAQRLQVTRMTLSNEHGVSAHLDCVLNDWVTVQATNYRFHAIDDERIVLKAVIGEFLACEASWNE